MKCLFRWLFGIFWVGVAALWAFQKTYYEGPVSSHFDGKAFFNDKGPKPDRQPVRMLWKLLWDDAPEWPVFTQNAQYDKPPERVDGDALRVSFVGHVTALLQTQGLNILTDPVWSERASPVSFLGPKRVNPPGIHWEDLPKVDVVLLSHNHYEHMDRATLLALWERDRPVILTPLGNDTILAGWGIESFALDWGGWYLLEPGVRVTLEPLQHWSSRLGPLDRNRALWGAFVIQLEGGNIYFAGDTGYGDGEHFKDVGEKYGPFRFAMLPIGTYRPSWFMSYAHQNPEEAVKAHGDLGSAASLGIHHRTFPLSYTPFEEPAEWLERASKDAGLPKGSFRVLWPGEVWQL